MPRRRGAQDRPGHVHRGQVGSTTQATDDRHRAVPAIPRIPAERSSPPSPVRTTFRCVPPSARPECRDRRWVPERLVEMAREAGKQADGIEPNDSSVWMVEKRSATRGRTAARRRPGRRSRSRTSGPARSTSSAMSAVTTLESIPPLRNTPTGTSLRRRSRTASRTAPAPSSVVLEACNPASARRRRPVPSTRGSPVPRQDVAGRKLRMPSKIDSRRGYVPYWRYRPSARDRRTRERRVLGRITFSSEP